jgi:hypothetical protein
MKTKISIAAMLASGVLILSACGGDTYVRVSGTTTVSKGQELVDLQKALEAGAVTQDEYEKLRAIVMKRDQ